MIKMSYLSLFFDNHDKTGKKSSMPNYLLPFQEPTSLQFKSAEFAKSPKDRHMSFQERKEAMLEAARKKYRAKHGIPDP